RSGIQPNHSSIGRIWNINRTHPGGSAVRGTVEFPKVASKEAGPKLVDESVTHTADVRIDSEPFLVAPMPRFIRRLLRPGLSAVCRTPQIIAKKRRVLIGLKAQIEKISRLIRLCYRVAAEDVILQNTGKRPVY